MLVWIDETLTNYVLAINDFLYQWWLMPLVLLAVGAWMTVNSGFVQFRRFPLAVKRALGGVFKRKTTEKGTITPFQALSTALAATVGNGNIGTQASEAPAYVYDFAKLEIKCGSK